MLCGLGNRISHDARQRRAMQNAGEVFASVRAEFLCAAAHKILRYFKVYTDLFMQGESRSLRSDMSSGVHARCFGKSFLHSPSFPPLFAGD